MDGVEVGFVIEKKVGELLDSQQELSCEQLWKDLASKEKKTALLCCSFFSVTIHDLPFAGELQ